MSEGELSLDDVQGFLSHSEGIEYKCKTVGEWGEWQAIEWKMFLGVYKQTEKYQFRKAGEAENASIDDIKHTIDGSEWVSLTTSTGKTLILSRKEIDILLTC